MNSTGIYNSTLRRILRARKTLALVGVSVFVMGVAIPPAGATSSSNWPYPTGTSGYDVSYPQCTSSTSYSSGGFAIIGLGGGRPFQANGCAASEWGAALAAGATSISIYINTGYSGAYSRDITSACSANVPSTYKSGSKLAQAWEIGCSEADFAFQTALSDVINPNAPASTSSPSNLGGGMWWADIETGNSWSTNTSLNQATIQGIVSELASPVNSAYTPEAGLPVGIYSNTAFWNKITGKSLWAPKGSSGEWIAASSCSSTFDGNTAYVAQHGTTAVGDADTAC